LHIGLSCVQAQTEVKCDRDTEPAPHLCAILTHYPKLYACVREKAVLLEGNLRTQINEKTPDQANKLDRRLPGDEVGRVQPVDLIQQI
jgi:hypothetical protein